MELNLSERLALIAEAVRPGDVIADIGTDHGYLPIWLIQNKICQKAILADINEGPLEKAEFNIKKYLGDAEIDLRKGNGLKILHPGEADTIVIAGMGGILIKKILAASSNTAKSANRLILQPRRDAAILREYLINESGFIIVEEKVVIEKKKFSEIMVAVPSEDVIDDETRLKLKFVENLADRSGLPEEFFYEFPKLYFYGNKSVEDMIKFRLKGALMIKDSIIKRAYTSESRVKLSIIENRIKHLEIFLNLYKSEFK